MQLLQQAPSTWSAMDYRFKKHTESMGEMMSFSDRYMSLDTILLPPNTSSSNSDMGGDSAESDEVGKKKKAHKAKVARIQVLARALTWAG